MTRSRNFKYRLQLQPKVTVPAPQHWIECDFDKYVLFAKVTNALCGISQRVANTPRHPITNLPEGCPYPLTPCKKICQCCQQPRTHSHDGCPDNIQSGNLCAIPGTPKESKKLKPRSNRVLQIMHPHLSRVYLNIVCQSL
jgi:hypothetical protein